MYYRKYTIGKTQLHIKNKNRIKIVLQCSRDYFKLLYNRFRIINTKTNNLLVRSTFTIKVLVTAMSASRRTHSKYSLIGRNRKRITPAEGRGSIRDPEERYRESPLVTEKHRKVLRQLLTVLEDLIDENESKENMKGINYNII